MKAENISTDLIYQTAIQCNGDLARTAKLLGFKNRSAIFSRLSRAGLLLKLRESTGTFTGQTATLDSDSNEKLVINESNDGNTVQLNYVGTKIKTEDDLLAHTKFDMTLYEIDRAVVNNWEVAGKHGANACKGIWKTGLLQIKIWLRRKKVDRLAVESLLQQLENKSPVVPVITYRRDKRVKHKRALELAIMDPHYGMLAFKGESDHAWNLELCEQTCMWAIDRLIALSSAFGPFDEIVFPFGNDFLHHDNLQHTTTKGTFQSEAISFHYVYERAIKLALAIVDRMTTVAPVKVIQISGNHDQIATFTLGHLLKAYYRNNENVSVDVSPSPYKFYRFGTNLIGFDHGHSINPARLSTLMAHECMNDWAQTTYREWHLGDQHRKGTAKPVTMEEQGVSVEYLPSLTPPNGWHRKKAYNWQQRGAMAFVWDYHEGPLSRIPVNLNSYTGRPTGT